MPGRSRDVLSSTACIHYEKTLSDSNRNIAYSLVCHICVFLSGYNINSSHYFPLKVTMV